MRRIAIILLAVTLLATTGAALTQTSPGFDLTWNVIGGGGSESASGSFRLQGTIGQSLAGPPASHSANFGVEGGFWAGAPLPPSWELYLPAFAHDA